ncbi:MAG: SRPBCC domain-containing protein [Bryobacterales bacterium]|nr:SRPBCC domain-containing protein [Bryobacterales bacterium]
MNSHTHTTVELPFPAHAVYSAWTTETAVKQWLTPYARIDVPHGIFELWGAALPEAPTQPATRLLAVRENEMIHFAWNVRGGEGTIEVELTARRESTHLSLRTALPPMKTGMAHPHDFFSTAIENLRRHLAGGTPAWLPHYGAQTHGDPSLHIEIEAPPDKVFDALITPAQLNRYIGPSAIVEPHAGGRYTYGWQGGGPIKILDIEPNRKLSVNWHYPHENEEMPETVVTWTLEGSGNRTRLTLVHSGFAKKRPADDYRSGWMKYMNSMKSMLELGPLFTATHLEGPAGNY